MGMRKVAGVVIGAALISTLAFSMSSAQQPPLAPPYKVTPLLKSSVSGDASREALMISVEWPANTTTGRHTHPGDEYATVLEGELLTRADGGEWRTIAAGQAYHQPAGIVHETKTGDKPARSIGVLVVEKGKPLVAPVK